LFKKMALLSSLLTFSALHSSRVRRNYVEIFDTCPVWGQSVLKTSLAMAQKTSLHYVIRRMFVL
jgi:hypothetical protein